LNGYNSELEENRVNYEYNISYISRVENTAIQKEGVSFLNYETTNTNEEIYKDYKNNEYTFSSMELFNQNNFNFKNNEEQIVDEIANNTFTLFDYFQNKYFGATTIDMIQRTTLYQNMNSYFYDFYNYWNEKHEDVANKLTKLVFTEHDERPNVNVSIEGDKVIYDKDELYTVGLNRIGEVISAKFENANDKTNLNLFSIGSELNFLDTAIKKDDNQFGVVKQNIPNATLIAFTDENLYDSDWFIESNSNERNLDLYINLINDIANHNGFNARYKNEIIYSNKETKEKIAFVDRTITEFGGYTHLNSVNLNITSKRDHFNDYDVNSVVMSQRYAAKNGYSVTGSKAFVFKTDVTDLSFTVAGLAYDYQNAFPLMYDSDIIPDTRHEATLFVNGGLFSNKGKILDNYIADNSEIVFEHTGNNEIKEDAQALTSALNINPFDITQGKSLNSMNGITDTLRNNAVSYLASFLGWSISFLFLIFFIIGLASIYVLTIKDIKKNLITLGILKANGYTNAEIALEYGLKMLIPSLIAGILAYPCLIGIQAIVFSQISGFFDFNITFNYFVLPYLLIFVLFNIFIFCFGYLSALFKLWHPTIKLINEQIDKERQPFSLKLIDKLNLKKYSTRMMLKQFAISWKKVVSLSFTMLISSILISLLILTPVGINNVKNNYYANQDYSLENDYQTALPNNPMSYSTYYTDQNDSETFYPTMYQKDFTGDLIDVSQINYADPDNSDSGDADVSYASDAFGLTFVYLKNKHFSINAFEKMINIYDNSDLEGILSNVIDQIIPGFFGQASPNVSNWEDALSSLVVAKMPPELLEYWNDQEKRNQFSIDFQTTKYTAGTDELISWYKNVVDENQVFNLIGIDDSNFVTANLNKVKNTNDIIASDKLLSDLNLSVGDTVQSTVSVPTLKIKTTDGYSVIDPNWWMYDTDEDGNNLIPITDTDMSKYTFAYAKGDKDTDNYEHVGYGMPYYTDEDGNYHSYYSVQNVVLKIPTNLINPDDWKIDGGYDLFNPDNGVVTEKDGFYLIHPYNWKISGQSLSTTSFGELLAYILAMGKEPDTWYDIATNNTFGDNGKLITTENEAKVVDYQIVDSIGVYDQDVAYTTRENVNTNLGVADGAVTSWFNGKLSKDEENGDIYSRFGIVVTDGNTSFAGLKNIKSQTAGTNFIGMKLQVFNTLYSFATGIVIIFMLIIIIIVIISISMVSGIFIEQFYNTIMLFKVMGYRNSEINRMILGIYLPLNLLLVTLGAFIPPIVASIVINVLASGGLLIPLNFIWSVPIILIVIIGFIFGLIYTINYRSFIKLHINEQLKF
jgi:hypothetical protein